MAALVCTSRDFCLHMDSFQFPAAAMSFNDLERGQGVPDEPLRVHTLRNHESASSVESTEFMHLTEQVGLHIFRINANVSTLEKLDRQLRNASDMGQKKADEMMKQFAELCEQTRSIVKDASEDVKALSLFSVNGSNGGRRSSPSRLLQGKLQNDFQEALFAFQKIQKAGIRKEKVALAQAKRRGSGAPAEEAEGQEQTEGAPVEQLQTQLPKSRLSQEELEFQESLIAEREAEIREIEQGVQELNEIFRDLGHMVQEQGGMIDNIEYNIGTIASNAEGADRELLQAHTYQRRAGRRALCLTIIIAFVVAIVLLALLA